MSPTTPRPTSTRAHRAGCRTSPAFYVGTAIVLAVVILAAACGSSRRSPETAKHHATYGIYRAVYEDPEGERRGFRLLLFASPPDRLHAEVLPPIGSAQLILDGGGGRVAVTAVEEGTAWVGEASSDAIARVVGVRLDLEGLVGTILGSVIFEPTNALRVTRSGKGGLPETLILESDAGRLELRIRKRKKMPADGTSTGTGEPPPGMEVRPIEEILDGEGPLLFPSLGEKAS